MTSCLEKLLALRPADDEPETIQAAIAAIKEKRAEFAGRALAVRGAERDKSLLQLSAHKLLAMDQEAKELDIGVQQADQLLASLGSKLEAQRRLGVIARLTARKADLEKRQAAVAEQFHAFYAEFSAEFMMFKNEIVKLQGEAESLSLDIKSSLQESGIPAGLWRVDKQAVCPSYVSRVCLPVANLPIGADARTPMLHVGAFWKPAYFEQAPAQVLVSDAPPQPHHAAKLPHNDMDGVGYMNRSGLVRGAWESWEK